jgi:sterol desaturase/sphingolipid hydroxylase (fatty acid hydroxylase superfamily)
VHSASREEDESLEQAAEVPLMIKVVAVGLWIVVFLVWERLRPAAIPPAAPRAGEAAFGWRRIARNVTLFLVNSAISPLIVVPLSLWAASHSLGWRPDWWSGWQALLLDIVIMDLLIYAWHRANHVVPFLWRFHEVHHLDRFLDVSSAVRFHWGEVILSAVFRMAFIIVLDIPIASVIVFETIVLLSAVFHHSNVKLPAKLEAALGKVFITPAIHWVHHHAVRRDTDSNYGTLFSFWDPLFRSRSPNPRTADMRIGVERRFEQDLPKLLLRPFQSEEARAVGPKSLPEQA